MNNRSADVIALRKNLPRKAAIYSATVGFGIGLVYGPLYFLKHTYGSAYTFPVEYMAVPTLGFSAAGAFAGTFIGFFGGHLYKKARASKNAAPALAIGTVAALFGLFGGSLYRKAYASNNSPEELNTLTNRRH